MAETRESAVLAAQLRTVIGQLVRAVRVVDTLAPGEAEVLGLLEQVGPQTTAEMAQRQGMRHQAAAKIVKELTNNGFVRVQEHNPDGRKFLLHLTPVGRAVLDQERRQRGDRLGIAIDETLSSSQRRDLERAVDILEHLAKQLQGVQ